MKNPSRKVFIRRLYENLLRREPLPSETLYWMEFFKAGCSENQVRAEFMKGTEFLLELEHCLRRRLGRPPVHNEISIWQEKLSNSVLIPELDSALKIGA